MNIEFFRSPGLSNCKDEHHKFHIILETQQPQIFNAFAPKAIHQIVFAEKEKNHFIPSLYAFLWDIMSSAFTAHIYSASAI